MTLFVALAHTTLMGFARITAKPLTPEKIVENSFEVILEYISKSRSNFQFILSECESNERFTFSFYNNTFMTDLMSLEQQLFAEHHIRPGSVITVQTPDMKNSLNLPVICVNPSFRNHITTFGLVGREDGMICDCHSSNFNVSKYCKRFFTKSYNFENDMDFTINSTNACSLQLYTNEIKNDSTLYSTFDNPSCNDDDELIGGTCTTSSIFYTYLQRMLSYLDDYEQIITYVKSVLDISNNDGKK